MFAWKLAPQTVSTTPRPKDTERHTSTRISSVAAVCVASRRLNQHPAQETKMRPKTKRTSAAMGVFGRRHADGGEDRANGGQPLVEVPGAEELIGRASLQIERYGDGRAERRATVRRGGPYAAARVD